MKVWDGRLAGGAAGESPRFWSFLDCTLDERRLELRVAGAAVPLDRKPMQALLYLLRHAGALVTKDELATAVWPGRIVTDSNLTKTVSIVRAALGAPPQAAIETVHGYGYRFVAALQVRALDTPTDPGPAPLADGDAVPHRSDWRLQGRLGDAETWIAVQAGTGRRHVFRFAGGPQDLAPLRREIALQGLLSDCLPSRGDILRLRGWNLDQPPFWIETEYLPDGDLSRWGAGRGGWAAIPAAERIACAAAVADALAAIHAVGVMHKNLRPANVLIRPDRAGICLADFRSGGLRDAGLLDEPGSGGVEPAGAIASPYLAPELIAGQPFSARSDIYALGVLLYQLAIGDPRRPLAPGWERDISDPLLREDIAEAAAGDPAQRLADAGQLAARLRSLESRRRAAATAERVRIEAEQSVRVRQQLRRTRAVLAAALTVAAAAAVSTAVVWDARNRVRLAMETEEAVNAFLNRDVLAQADNTESRTHSFTLRQLLDRAAGVVDKRFAGHPAAAARVYTTLGDAYASLSEYALALEQFHRASAAHGAAGTEHGDAARDVRLRSAEMLGGIGRHAESCAQLRSLGADHPVDPARASEWQLGLSLGTWICDLSPSATAARRPEIDRLVNEFEHRGLTDRPVYADALRQLGQADFDLGNYAESALSYRRLTQLSARQYGEAHLRTARARGRLANALTLAGHLDEADAELGRALADEREWTAEDHGILVLYLSILRLEQGRFDEAGATAVQALASTLARNAPAAALAAEQVHAESLLMTGRGGESIAAARRVVELSRELKMDTNWYELPARAVWAEALLMAGRAPEAREVLGEAAVGPATPVDRGVALLLRSQGLVLRHGDDRAAARQALDRSAAIYRQRLGTGHWRTRRAVAELASIDAERGGDDAGGPGP